MDLRRLQVFCKVVELKSFTRAADAVFLSQPTVSEHIRSLEEYFEQKLLDRLGREVLPTQAGQILYKYARRMLQLNQEAVQAVNQYSGKLAGHLSVGASTIPGTYVLPGFIGAFKEQYPAIHITMKIANSRLVADAVMRGDAEFGVVGARWNDPSLEWQEIFADELSLTVYPGHPWSKRGSITLAELADEHFIMRERDSGTRRFFSQVLTEQGFDLARLDVIAEMGSSESIRQSIKARIGVSIMSRYAVAEDVERETLSVVAIEGVHFARPFYLIRRKNRQSSPISNTFLDSLRPAL